MKEAIGKIEQNLRFALNANSTVPLYLQFKEQMMIHIRCGRIAVGAKLPDIKTLAEMAGTSVKTVNSGLNELLRERICVRSPKRGTFVAGKEQKRNSNVRRVCLVYHTSSLELIRKDTLRQRLIYGIEEGCRQHHLELVFLTGNPVEKIDFYVASNAFEVLGILFLQEMEERDNHLAAIFPQQRFLYFNDRCALFDLSPRNVYGVFHDDFSGGYEIGCQLAREKVRKIGVVIVDLGLHTYAKRIQGFRQALMEHGYHWETDVVEYHMPNSDFGEKYWLELHEFGERAARQFLRISTGIPDAIFVVNDVIAEGVWLELRWHNLEKKILLWGYDNIFPEISRRCNFSTVDINFVNMGIRAIDLITTSSLIPKNVFLPPQVIRRTNNE